MPVLTHLGPAAPCGPGALRVGGLRPRIPGQPLRRAVQHAEGDAARPDADGATFTTAGQDFLVSDNHDFHPTDVLEDADGSLLVIDTGGWYKLCCPTSQLHKPDMLGGDLSHSPQTVRRRVDDPRGLKIAWDKATPAELADSARRCPAGGAPAGHRDAGAKGATAALPALTQTVASVAVAGTAQCRLGRLPHRRRGARARWPGRRWATPTRPCARSAIHAASVCARPGCAALAGQSARNGTPHNQRAAAEALGRLGDVSIVPALLAACGTPADRALEHSRIYALIELGDPKAVEPGLKSETLRVRQAALIALDMLKARPA